MKGQATCGSWNAAQAINCQTGMNIELSEDERKVIIQAWEHYDAYLHATSRRDGHAKELAERLQGQKPKHGTFVRATHQSRGSPQKTRIVTASGRANCGVFSPFIGGVVQQLIDHSTRRVRRHRLQPPKAPATSGPSIAASLIVAMNTFRLRVLAPHKHCFSRTLAKMKDLHHRR